MKTIAFPLAFTFFLAGSPAPAAPAAWPPSIQSILEQVKGEYVVLDQDQLSTSLSLQADGRGRITNRNGSSELHWQIKDGKIALQLVEPTLEKSSEYIDDDQGNSVEIIRVDALQSLTLEFQKLDGLRGIVWKLGTTTQKSYLDHPEKGTETSSVTTENIKLVAGRQFKNFAPKQGQTLSVSLPEYLQDPGAQGFAESISLLVRLEAANVARVVLDHPSAVKQLFWTLDQGSLRLSDGQGYTVRYRLYQSEGISARLVADVQTPAKKLMTEEPSVTVHEGVQAKGFDAQSALFQGCWDALQAQYCFAPNRAFTFTTQYTDDENFSSTGLWKLEGNQIVVNRYRTLDYQPLEDLSEMLRCEQELADDSIVEKSCLLGQSRSYQLLNQDAKSIAVYRILKNRDYVNHLAHAFKRSE